MDFFGFFLAAEACFFLSFLIVRCINREGKLYIYIFFFGGGGGGWGLDFFFFGFFWFFFFLDFFQLVKFFIIIIIIQRGENEHQSIS